MRLRGGGRRSSKISPGGGGDKESQKSPHVICERPHSARVVESGDIASKRRLLDRFSEKLEPKLETTLKFLVNLPQEA